MKCEVCKKSVAKGEIEAVYRVNPKGEKGRWRCGACLTPEQAKALDPETLRLVSVITERPVFRHETGDYGFGPHGLPDPFPNCNH